MYRKTKLLPCDIKEKARGFHTVRISKDFSIKVDNTQNANAAILCVNTGNSINPNFEDVGFLKTEKVYAIRRGKPQKVKNVNKFTLPYTLSSDQETKEMLFEAMLEVLIEHSDPESESFLRVSDAFKSENSVSTGEINSISTRKFKDEFICPNKFKTHLLEEATPYVSAEKSVLRSPTGDLVSKVEFSGDIFYHGSDHGQIHADEVDESSPKGFAMSICADEAKKHGESITRFEVKPKNPSSVFTVSGDESLQIAISEAKCQGSTLLVIHPKAGNPDLIVLSKDILKEIPEPEFEAAGQLLTIEDRVASALYLG